MKKPNLDYLGKVFTVVLTLLFLLIVFVLGDAILVGIISLLVLIWDDTLALQVFKWGIVCLFVPQVLLTIPATIRCIAESEDDKSGS